MSSPATSAVERWPRQIKFIIGNEACERFSYYGMRSILAGYITGAVLRGGLGLDERHLHGNHPHFVFANYFMPLFGAWLSDKLIGRYHTILWVSLFYCAGHGVLACSDFAGTSGQAGLPLHRPGADRVWLRRHQALRLGVYGRPVQAGTVASVAEGLRRVLLGDQLRLVLLVPRRSLGQGPSRLQSRVWGAGHFDGPRDLIFWRGTKHYIRVPTNRE